MNIQTELRDDQTAQLTVEIDADRLDRAKKTAARRIARKVNIPGFRKGKAPYHILVRSGLEPQIMMDAIDELSQEIYRETLEQSDLEPYGPGSFDDFKDEPNPTFIYTVPLQPVVNLKGHRDVRLDYTKPEVSDDMVDDAMKRLQEQEALAEESSEPAVMGNRLTVNIHSEFADDPPAVDTEVANEAETSDETVEDETAETEANNGNEDEAEAPPKGTTFIHEHDAQIRLDTESEPIMPGFSEALIGASVGDERQFELTVPEDDTDYPEIIRGRKVDFHVTVSRVEVVTLPELNDELAARITSEEDEPLTLLQLRMRMRENIENELVRQVNETYASEVIGKIVDQAEIHYPEAMVEDQIEGMIEDLDRMLKRQNLSLETYMSVTGTTKADLQEQYREQAEDTLKRSLVLREVVREDNIRVTEDDLNERIEEMLKDFGEQAEAMRSMFQNQSMRASMMDDLLQKKLMNHIIALGKGEATFEPAQPDPVTDTVATTEAGESTDEAEAEETTEDTQTVDAEQTSESNTEASISEEDKAP